MGQTSPCLFPFITAEFCRGILSYRKSAYFQEGSCPGVFCEGDYFRGDDDLDSLLGADLNRPAAYKFLPLVNGQERTRRR